MRNRRLLLILYALVGISCSRPPLLPDGVSWDKGTNTFLWWGSQVKLPRGFTFHLDQGGDTLAGHFRAPDGKLTIYLDIGWYAGAYASAKDASAFEERIIEGARVWRAIRDLSDGRGGISRRVAVTFPDSGCANFFLYSDRVEDAQVISQLAQTYRPGSQRDTSKNGACPGVSVSGK